MEKASIKFFDKTKDVYRFPDWGNSRTTYVYLNPRMNEEFKAQIRAALESAGVPWSSIVVTSSGTSGLPKVYLFSKTAFLNAAERVMEHFKLNASDRWLCPLPLFHVGALSIGARAFISGAEFDLFSFENWSPVNFVETLQKNATTHTSLVPTQLFDLVKAGISAPSSLKVVLLGGDRLESDLYARAQALGWPIVPTFGMTETCGMWALALAEPLAFGAVEGLGPMAHKKVEGSSTVARSSYPDARLQNSKLPESASSPLSLRESASSTLLQTSLESPTRYFPFQSLSGVDWELKDARLLVKSDSLFSAQLEIGDGTNAQWNYRDPNSAWLSQDIAVQINDANFFVTGRADELKKVRGELVNLREAKESLSKVLEILPSQLNILIDEDGRPRLCLSREVEKKITPVEALRRLNAHCPAYLKMDRVDFVEVKTPATWKEGSYGK